MHAGEFLQASHSPKSEHGSLPSPEREVRVLRSVVLVATDLLAVLVSNILHRSTVRWASVCDDDLSISVSFHRFPEEFQCSGLIALLCDEALQDFALMINGAPKVMPYHPLTSDTQFHAQP